MFRIVPLMPIHVHNSIKMVSIKLYNETLKEVTEIVQMVLCFSGVLLNMLVIAAAIKRKCKTSTQLVISLATADMLVAGFHSMFPSIAFDTQWTVSGASSIFTIDFTDDSANKTSLIGSSSVGAIRNPTNMFSGNLFTGIDVDLTDFVSGVQLDMVNMSDISDINDLVAPSELKNATKIDSDPTMREVTVLAKLLSAFYLMPNIAAVLGMFSITACLLITVANPLKQHIWLSKKRGKITVLSNWFFSFSVSLVVFVYTLEKEVGERSVINVGIAVDVNVIIWYLTLVVFFVISGMYVAIIYMLTCRRASKSLTKENRPIYVRATVTAFSITSTYAVCYLPFLWFSIAQRSTQMVTSEETVWKGLMQTLFILNTNVDPLIYAFRMSEVSKGLKTRFKCMCIK